MILEQCPRCDGDGAIEDMVYDDESGQSNYVTFECPVCCGSGQVEALDEDA